MRNHGVKRWSWTSRRLAHRQTIPSAEGRSTLRGSYSAWLVGRDTITTAISTRLTIFCTSCSCEHVLTLTSKHYHYHCYDLFQHHPPSQETERQQAVEEVQSQMRNEVSLMSAQMSGKEAALQRRVPSHHHNIHNPHHLSTRPYTHSHPHSHPHPLFSPTPKVPHSLSA